MRYSEYWFLETAATGGVPVRLVVGSKRGLEAQWFKPWHGLAPDHVFETLSDLYERGLILIRRRDGEFLSRRHYPPWARGETSRKQLEGWHYELSVSGAAAWEEVAQPDWSRYYEWDAEEDPSGPSRIRIIAARRSYAMRALRVEEVKMDLEIVPHTAKFRNIAPWQATYWKVLPQGWAVECLARWLDAEASYDRCEQLTSDHIETVQRDTQFFASWHKEHPNTPKTFDPG